MCDDVVIREIKIPFCRNRNAAHWLGADRCDAFNGARHNIWAPAFRLSGQALFAVVDLTDWYKPVVSWSISCELVFEIFELEYAAGIARAVVCRLHKPKMLITAFRLRPIRSSHAPGIPNTAV